MPMQEEIKTEGKFSYIERGEGKPLILLHGLFGALSNFKEVVDHFSDRYKVVIPMLPLYDLPVLETSAKRLAKFLNEHIVLNAHRICFGHELRKFVARFNRTPHVAHKEGTHSN